MSKFNDFIKLVEPSHTVEKLNIQHHDVSEINFEKIITPMYNFICEYIYCASGDKKWYTISDVGNIIAMVENDKIVFTGITTNMKSDDEEFFHHSLNKINYAYFNHAVKDYLKKHQIKKYHISPLYFIGWLILISLQYLIEDSVFPSISSNLNDNTTLIDVIKFNKCFDFSNENEIYNKYLENNPQINLNVEKLKGLKENVRRKAIKLFCLYRSISSFHDRFNIFIGKHVEINPTLINSPDKILNFIEEQHKDKLISSLGEYPPYFEWMSSTEFDKCANSSKVDFMQYDYFFDYYKDKCHNNNFHYLLSDCILPVLVSELTLNVGNIYDFGYGSHIINQKNQEPKNNRQTEFTPEIILYKKNKNSFKPPSDNFTARKYILQKNQENTIFSSINYTEEKKENIIKKFLVDELERISEELNKNQYNFECKNLTIDDIIFNGEDLILSTVINENFSSNDFFAIVPKENEDFSINRYFCTDKMIAGGRTLISPLYDIFCLIMISFEFYYQVIYFDNYCLSWSQYHNKLCYMSNSEFNFKLLIPEWTNTHYLFMRKLHCLAESIGDFHSDYYDLFDIAYNKQKQNDENTIEYIKSNALSNVGSYPPIFKWYQNSNNLNGRSTPIDLDYYSNCNSQLDMYKKLVESVLKIIKNETVEFVKLKETVLGNIINNFLEDKTNEAQKSTDDPSTSSSSKETLFEQKERKIVNDVLGFKSDINSLSLKDLKEAQETIKLLQIKVNEFVLSKKLINLINSLLITIPEELAKVTPLTYPDQEDRIRERQKIIEEKKIWNLSVSAMIIKRTDELEDKMKKEAVSQTSANPEYSNLQALVNTLKKELSKRKSELETIKIILEKKIEKI